MARNLAVEPATEPRATAKALSRWGIINLAARAAISGRIALSKPRMFRMPNGRLMI